jgi:hypothetical protein
MLFRKIIHVYSKNRKKHVTTLYEQNEEFLNVEADGTYCNNSVSMD